MTHPRLQFSPSKMKMDGKIPLNMIVATCNNMGIGKGGSMPWPRLANEGKHFQAITSRCKDPAKQNAVLIGRKTWESIPADRRPLKNRLNVVISRTMDKREVPDGVHVFNSFNDAMHFLTESEMAKNIETIWNIGGRDIYQLGLRHPSFSRLYLTRISAEYDCDVFFPDLDWTKLEKITDPNVPSGDQEEKGIKYHYEVFQQN